MKNAKKFKITYQMRNNFAVNEQKELIEWQMETKATFYVEWLKYTKLKYTNYMKVNWRNSMKKMQVDGNLVITKE